MKTIQIKSIQVKFLIWIIPVVTIVLGILALITYQKEKEKQLKFIDDSSAQIVQGRGNEIEKWLKSIILELQQISNHPDVKSMSWKQMEQVLRLIAEKRKDTYGFLILVEKNGDYYSTLKGKADISLKDKDYFRAVFEENKPFAISNPYYSITTGKPIFVINVPILSSDGQLLGSLGGIVYLSTLSKIAADIRIGESGYGWIVDSEGLVFAHPDSSVILKLNVLKSTEKGFENLDKIGSKMLNSKAGAGLVRRPDKVEEYLVFSRIPLSPNWTLGVAVPSAEIFSEVDNLLLRLCVSFFGTLLALTLLIYLLTRIIITKPLKQLTEFTDSVANGHLFRSINIDSKDEIGVMAQSLRKMSHKMSEITEKIKQSSSSIANGSKELSSSTAQIAQGASEQAAAAEEVSAAIEEMTASITQNAENAGLTESIAEKVVKDIEEVMVSVKSTLSAISTIAAKITIINEIAGKTDLLAINAAVEAARAGEKGKGFAVVATEVRKLAENSKNASIEINHVSSETVHSAKESGRLLEAVVPLIKKNADLVREIRAASSEQNSGVEQINKAIQQLAQVTQENAASAEEMAASSEELSKQADVLNEIIEFFKVTEAEVKQNLSLRAYHKMLEAVAVFEQNNKNLIKKSGDSLSTEKGEHGKSGKETKESGVVIDIDNDNLDSDFTQMER